MENKRLIKPKNNLNSKIIIRNGSIGKIHKLGTKEGFHSSLTYIRIYG